MNNILNKKRVNFNTKPLTVNKNYSPEGSLKSKSIYSPTPKLNGTGLLSSVNSNDGVDTNAQFSL